MIRGGLHHPGAARVHLRRVPGGHRPAGAARPPAPPKPDGAPPPGRCPRSASASPSTTGRPTSPPRSRACSRRTTRPNQVEILVYCDGCSDDTERVARELAAAPSARGRIKVIVESRRLGKPTGLNTLGPAATGELLLLNDVRQPLSPNAVARPRARPRRPGRRLRHGEPRARGRRGQRRLLALRELDPRSGVALPRRRRDDAARSR